MFSWAVALPIYRNQANVLGEGYCPKNRSTTAVQFEGGAKGEFFDILKLELGTAHSYRQLIIYIQQDQK